MEKQVIFIMVILFSHACNSQGTTKDKIIGGPCQGCDAIFEYENKKLTSIDTLPAFSKNQPQLKITGIVYQKDGKTPAKDVILYIYHTNREGIYETKGDEKGWARRHGYIRGWIKTNADGRYTFYTFRPAAYPNGVAPEHIHITVKEPGKNEYYIEDYFFDNDPLLTQTKRKNLSNRGGSGISFPVLKNGIYTVKRDIVLGLNIENYN
ncbi:intradiol ring-cleavage dioxygenase [Aquimarina sp. 2201CG5-10]|uniref:dioxygenase family protein n=1 Tax=Aquimarina callyspongiae TaxID=3098150 RepID=UPI002AB5575B|nr:intradiol ring-cleavage dioxygenase [Aquimarina sp. 2201CG5-10]MDY8137311.1 intradiol ring-cleavage dioxygenase [Aquimarina sp. 2201CG5-10]